MFIVGSVGLKRPYLRDPSCLRTPSRRGQHGHCAAIEFFSGYHKTVSQKGLTCTPALARGALGCGRGRSGRQPPPHTPAPARGQPESAPPPDWVRPPPAGAPPLAAPPVTAPPPAPAGAGTRPAAPGAGRFS
eukprot:1078263-Prorocentrum_minimum.AAC.3